MSYHHCAETGRIRSFGPDGYSLDGEPRVYNAAADLTLGDERPSYARSSRYRSPVGRPPTGDDPTPVILGVASACLALLGLVVWTIVRNPVVCISGFTIWGLCFFLNWRRGAQYEKSLVVRGCLYGWPVAFLGLCIWAGIDLYRMLS